MDDSDRTAGPARRGTHHDRILAELRERILSREWPPGFRLPFETDLAERHGVSRMTMNKVLSQLAREGFLLRRRKLGTVVAAPRAQSAVLEIHDIEAEVRALGLPYSYALLDRERRPLAPQESAEAGVPPGPGPEVLFLRGVHLGGDEPFCLERRLINLEAAPEAAQQDFSAEGPGKWLRRAVPWSSAEHRIRAVSAKGPVARLLEIRPGEACLEILRRTEFSGRWVTVVRQTYPGHRHQLLAQFAPQPALP